MNLNDPRIKRMLHSYERHYLAQSQFEEARRSLPVNSSLPSNGFIPEMGAGFELQRPVRSSAPGQVSEAFRGLNNFFSSVSRTISAADRAVTPYIKAVVEGLRPAANFLESAKPLLNQLSNFTEPLLEHLLEDIRRYQEAVRDGNAVLEASEYGFADHLWNRMYISSFAGLADVNPRVRDAVATNKLLAATRADDFGEDLYESFESSDFMRRRWPVMEAAFEAHQRREYQLSIPAMLPQVEGVIVDTMVLKDLAVKRNGKWFLLDEDGGLKLGRDKKPLRPIMLTSALQNARLEDHHTLEGAASFLADSLVQKRNDIMHGHDPSYGRAKLSVQCLLMLTLLADAVTDLEEKRSF